MSANKTSKVTVTNPKSKDVKFKFSSALLNKSNKEKERLYSLLSEIQEKLYLEQLNKWATKADTFDALIPHLKELNEITENVNVYFSKMTGILQKDLNEYNDKLKKMLFEDEGEILDLLLEDLNKKSEIIDAYKNVII